MKKLFLLLALLGFVLTSCEGGLGNEENGGTPATPKIELEKQNIEVEFEPAEYEVAVTSPYSWEATTKNDWIEIKTATGIAGTKTLKFSVARNEEEDVREGTIVLKNEDYNLVTELYVTQGAFVPEFVVEQTALEFDYKGGEATIPVTANFDYDITCPSWITYTKLGNGVKLTISENSSIESRTAEVKIFSEKYNLNGAVVTVSQDATLIGAIVTRNGVKGIIFYADDNVTKIMSVEETRLAWSTEWVTTGATDEYNGANNMAVIKKISGWEEKYPAFKWCADYGANWYLPACYELLEIYNQRSVLNAALEANGYTKLDLSDYFYYWSSTEATDSIACDVYFNTSYGNYSKSSTLRVRAVQAF